MESKIIRGARRLLATAGVITLVCSVVAPAAVSASDAGRSTVDQHNGQGRGDGHGQVDGHGQGNGQGQQNGQGQGAGGQDPSGERGARKVWVCHATDSDTNPWELIEVSEHATGVHADHHEDAWFRTADEIAALTAWAMETLGEGLGLAELHQSMVQQLDDAQLAALTDFCGAGDDAIVDEEIVDDTDGDDTDDGRDDGQGDDGGDDGPDDDRGDDDRGDDGQGDDGGDDGQAPGGPRDPKPIRVAGDEVTPPAAPPAALPEPQISADEVLAAPAQTPVVRTPVPAGRPDVLGVSTARVPTRELATAGVTSLPRTGTDHTTLLALVGGLLVAAGVGLEALGRRGHLAAVGGRR